VLVISPQPWDHIAVSKHHYAIELARRGNRVFFLEPPALHAAAPVQISAAPGQPGVTIVRYRLPFPGVLRFHARPVFDWLMRRHVQRLRRAIGMPLDAVWCFEYNLFSDLRWFGAPVRIYHPVDAVVARSHIRPATTASLVLSVSESILQHFRGLAVPAHLIGHGLADAFAHHARASIASAGDGGRASIAPQVGYVGNILHPSLDTGNLRRMVECCPEATFHFWGPYTERETGFAAPEEQLGFVRFLADMPNARLHGSRTPEALAAAMQQMDAFALAYTTKRLYDGSNSHKILEYLSTGKVVVSSRMSAYAARRDLLVMTEEGNDELPELMKATLARLDEHNHPARQMLRRQFALDNSYARQLDRVVDLLTTAHASASRPSGLADRNAVVR
jgi:glycosyltransferase involved in cell wall biosynthesis